MNCLPFSEGGLPLLGAQLHSVFLFLGLQELKRCAYLACSGEDQLSPLLSPAVQASAARRRCGAWLAASVSLFPGTAWH